MSTDKGSDSGINETSLSETTGDITNIENEEVNCGGETIEYIDESLKYNPTQPKTSAAADFIEKIENYAHSIGFTKVGYAQVPPELILTDKSIIYPNAIVLTIEMDKKIIETAPGPEAQKLSELECEIVGIKAAQLSDYLRENGYATQAASPCERWVKFAPLAQNAGLGWIAKSGLLITPELGPRQKISAVFTSIENLPITNHNEHSWISEYCDKCDKCIKACPENAIIEKEYSNGYKGTKVIAEKCIGCTDGCTFCLEDCPFDKKEYLDIKNRFERINAKLEK